MLPSGAITRLDLSSTFSEFELAMSRRGFIGPRVARPVITISQASDVGKIPIEQLLVLLTDKRAPGGGYTRFQGEFEKFSYATYERGAEEVLDDRNVRIFRDMIDAEGIARGRAEDRVCRNYEIDVASLVYDTATWTGDALTTAITNEWDDKTNAIPIDDVEAARQKIIDGSGLVPNALIVNRKQFFKACQTDQIRDRIKAGGAELKAGQRITEQALAELFDLDMLLVARGDAIKATNNRGQALSASQIWSDEYMMLARVATTNDPQEPCVARTFIWTGDGPGAPGSDEEIAVIVEEYREEARRGSVIRVRNDRDLVQMYPQAGHLLSNAIT